MMVSTQEINAVAAGVEASRQLDLAESRRLGVVFVMLVWK